MNRRGQVRKLSLCNFYSKNSRGLSTIVVSLIIILLALVAIGTVWFAVNNLLKTGTEQVGFGKLTFSAEIQEVNIDNSSNNVSLIIERNHGKGEVSGIKFIFYNETGTEIITEDFALKELEPKKFTFHLGMNVSSIIKVSIAPIFISNGKKTVGNIVNAYEIKEKTPEDATCAVCAPATCASLGYNCGSGYANGTCDETLNCGTCSGNERSCSLGTCVCNSGFGDCNNNNDCECDLSSNSCVDNNCVSDPYKKLMSKYSDKEVFLISDKNWKDVLPFVPVTTWTGNENCKRGYGTPANVCVYPTLIYHEEETGFDADSIIYFMQQYNANKATIIGATPQELDNLLITVPELGAGLQQGEIKRINADDYLSYWSDFGNVVYAQDNYELALLASTYASFINSPLIIQGTSHDSAEIFSGKNIICAGSVSPSGSSCNEQYNLESLQQKYTDETNTDKIILINPGDLNFKVNEEFQPEKSLEKINDLYSKMSLTAPILAGAKQEVIISTTGIGYASADNFIDSKINALGINAEYLTIIASPDAIEMSYFTPSAYLSADLWYYSEINDGDPLLDLAVGRIFGLTLSDSSSNIARSLFYEETLENEDKILSARGSPFVSSAAEVYAIGKALSAIGYQPKVTPGGTNPIEWEDRFFINYNDHGSYDWAGFYSSVMPNLDNSFIALSACSTCDFKEAPVKKDLFCARAIRKGAIGVIGATDESGYLNRGGLLAEIFAQGSTIGKAIINAKNSIMVYDEGFPNTMAWYTLLGDPTLKLKIIHTMPKPQLNLINGKNYELIVPAMRVEIPEDVKNLCAFPEQVLPLYPTASYNRQLDINYLFVSKFNSLEGVTGLSGDWELIKESTNNGEIFWIKSPVSYDNRYFTTANDYEFTNYEFDITFLGIFSMLQNLNIGGLFK